MHIRRCCRVTLFFCCLLSGLHPTASAQNHPIWTNLGIFGGNVQDIAVDPQNPDKIFAATYKGRGLFLSVDGGTSWQPIEMENLIEGEDTFNEQSVYAVTIAPGNPDIIWVGHNYWLAKSTDGGLTWIHIPNSTMQRDCTTCGGATDNWRLCLSIAIHPANPDVVYVGTGGAWASDAGGAVYATRDGGVSWNKLNSGANLDYRVEDLAISPDNPEIVWAVTNSNGYAGIWDGSVYRSDDGGKNFSILQPKPITGGILSVAPKPNDFNTVFVTGGWGIVQLNYDGVQWHASYPVADSRTAADVKFAASNTETVYAVWMRANDSFWQGDGLPKISRGSFDGSTWTWETFTADSQNATSFHCLAVHPTNAETIFGGDQSLGMLISQDHGQNWSPINEGLDAVIVYDVDADNNNTEHMLAASGSGLFERADGTTTWVRRHNGNFRSVKFHPSSGSSYFGGGTGFVARTTDNGTTWAYSNNLGAVYVGDIAVDFSDTSRIYITTGHYGQQVQRSTDGGARFQAVLDGVNQAGQSYSMNKVVIDPHDHLHLLAAGGNFYSPQILGDLWQSPDGGDTWQRTGLTNNVVNTVLIDPADPMVMYAGCGYSHNSSIPLFKSSDGGVTWAPQIDGLPNKRIFIAGLWAASPQFTMGVGWYGTVIYYDGQSTTIMDSGSSFDLYGIFGLSSIDVWAVGQKGTILHYDGSQWSPMDSGTSLDLNAVWAAAPDQVMAVGENGRILHFDGTVWQPMDSGTTEMLNGIFGLSGNQVYAVGSDGTIIQYEGTTWTAMDSNTTATLMSVWGADPANLFAVGSGETVLHFDGSTWSSIYAGSTDNTFGNVWGSAADNVYVTAGANGRMLRYDGMAWSESAIPGARNTLGLWGSGADTVFVSDHYSGLYLFDGTQWTTLRPPGTVHRSVTDLAVHRTDCRAIYAATLQAGVFVSPNQAAAWLNLGIPANSVFAIETGSLYAATGGGMYQLTGTGVVAGEVNDAHTTLGINGAQVTTDLGNQCLSIAGAYMMVMPAGIFDLYAVAEQYEMGTAEDVNVAGGDVTRYDFVLRSGNTVKPIGSDDGSNLSSGGGAYCFVHTLIPW